MHVTIRLDPSGQKPGPEVTFSVCGNSLVTDSEMRHCQFQKKILEQNFEKNIFENLSSFSLGPELANTTKFLSGH